MPASKQSSKVFREAKIFSILKVLFAGNGDDGCSLKVTYFGREAEDRLQIERYLIITKSAFFGASMFCFGFSLLYPSV